MSATPDWLIFALTALGFGLLSASMDRHAKQIFGVHPPKSTRLLRTASGWMALALALIPAIAAYGPSIGVSVWVGFLAISSTLVALLLTYRPRALRPAFYGAVALTGVLLITLMWPDRAPETRREEGNRHVSARCTENDGCITVVVNGQ
ncbi:MAG: DUF3325 domain-containing protein [Zoogloeaceae bacterium]|jgi:hypothetical protein|nr:DUF3325 domain-containing protein [Zoogloeaceae bacterium]